MLIHWSEIELDRIDRPDGVLSRPLMVLDLETSGLDPARDEILQVALLKLSVGDGTVERASTLVRPTKPVPRDILRLTKLDPEALASAPRWATVREELRTHVAGWAIGGHNVSFDLKFLSQGGLELPLGLDTWDWARVAFPRRDNHRLADFAQELLVPGRPHDAATDVLATYYLLAAIHRQLMRLGPATRTLVHRLMGPAWDWWQWDPGEWGGLEAALFRPAPEPAVLAPEPRSVPMGPIHTCFDADGPLARVHGDWQPRPGQAAMADAVEDALADRRVLVAEAGTGVGKSLAYLMPAIRQAVWEGERVVVATHTVALQDQLWEKDLPEALAALQLEDVPRALVKGRARYACLLKVEEEVGGVDMALDWGERVAAASLVVWLAETDAGERDEWVGGRAPGAQELWEAVAADPDACAGPRCKFAGPCFMRQSRRAAEAANLVVTNHALLLAHAAQGGVLPSFRHLVVDEAHHLPEVADQALGLRVDLVRSARILRDWAHPRGLLAHGTEMLGGRGPLIRGQLAEAAGRLASAAQELVHLGKKWRGGADGHAGGRWRERTRLAADRRPEWAASPAAEALTAALSEITATAGALADAIAAAEERLGDSERRSPRWLQLGRVERVLQELSEGISAFQEGADDWVDWWEWDAQGSQVILRRAPLNPGQLLDGRLWSQVPGGTVLTSATLTVSGSFAYLGGQLGLAPDVVVNRYPSPFATDEQSLLAVPIDFPHPNGAGHVDRVAAFVRELAGRLNGRLMVLTTSRAAVEALADLLEGELATMGVELLVQGVDGSPHQLARRLMTHPASVLLGTSGLWEGVDVKGPALAVVVVTRLPFLYPGEPLEEARAELLKLEGRSPFAWRSLPQAVLKFRQGFGRLLRSEQDRGAVVVLDPRILPPRYGTGRGTTYGRRFVSSLPDPQVVMAREDEVLDRVTAFAGQLPPAGAALRDSNEREADGFAHFGDQ